MKVCLLMIILCYPIFSVTGSMPGSMPMDQTVDQFYINYRHPVIQQGRLLLGTIVVKNNNPNGFILKLVSQNNSHLSDDENTSNRALIPYFVSIQPASGVIGDGVTTAYDKRSLVSEYVILRSINHTSYTDVALDIFLHIDQEISDLFLAGDYEDLIDVVYENYTTL